MTANVILVVRKRIRAEPARAFHAWTDPAHLVKWWGPSGVTCCGAEVDLRVGGKYRIGNRFADGSVVWISGVFERIEPPHRLSYSWTVEGAPVAEHSRVDVRFEDRSGETELILTHEEIPSEEIKREHALGWNGCLAGLDRLLSNG